jgi:hypothetical protein
MSPKSVEGIIRDYLDHSQKQEDGEFLVLLLNYLSHLVEEDEEVTLDDFGSYEADDFLNFYLQDQFPDDKVVIQKSKSALKNLFKFMLTKKLIDKEEEKEWKEIFR